MTMFTLSTPVVYWEDMNIQISKKDVKQESYKRDNKSEIQIKTLIEIGLKVVAWR